MTYPFKGGIQACIQDFQREGVQILGKGQTNTKRKINDYKSYIGDNFLITRSYKIKYIKGGKTKSIFENLIFSQKDFVCW